MKLQKHYTRSDKSQWKYEIVIPKDSVEKAGFKEGDELEEQVEKGKIELKKKKD